MSDIILYAAIACVLCLMLYFVLGKDVGEPTDKTFTALPGVGGPQTASSETFVYNDPHFDGLAGTGLKQIAKADDNFSPRAFLDAAAAAYSMILEAYAEGDKDTLKDLLDGPVFEAYETGIDTREESGLTQSTDLARLVSNKFVAADRTGKTGSISVEFDAELSAAIYNAEGELVDGDPDLLNRVVEVWVFERTLTSSNPNWLLVSVTEAGEDTPGSAPDFTPPEA